jgi:ribose transport system ATP-binding protein
MPAGPPLLEIHNVSKAFGTMLALRSVDLDVAPGEVHALVGHNGSGKSTLVKVLAGFHKPEPGSRAKVEGTELALGDPSAAAASGLRFVHQDLGLVEVLDAVDNVMLGQRYPTRWPSCIDWRSTRRRVRDLFGELGYAVPLNRPVAELSLQERTAVAIARALNHDEPAARVLVFDEPTAAMTTDEVHGLFDVIAGLRQSGIGIVYISHHLDEVFDISDRVSVLRNGSRIATRPTAELDQSSLVELMIGDVRVAQSRTSVRRTTSASAPMLQVNGLSSATIRNVSFSVGPGEVVGVAGIAGSGREALAAAVFGAVDRDGDVAVGGRRVVAGSPARSIRAGLGLLTADRVRTASWLDWSLSQNVTIPRVTSSLRGLYLNRRREERDAGVWLTRLDVDPAEPARALRTLSGGNQQRVLLARWLRAAPNAIVLDEPTQGVDIGAIGKIYATIDEFAAGGTAFLICSSSADELSLICDRVLVLSRGAIVADLSGASLTSTHIDRLCLDGADRLLERARGSVARA